jgi:SAM-dependent methyltransferase
MHAGEPDVEAWLSGLPVHEGFPCASTPRAFAHDESAYDATYGVDEHYAGAGLGAIELARRCAGGADGPILEVGCGSGHVSRGMAQGAHGALFLATDPSPAFLRLTQRKVEPVARGRTRFAILDAADARLLPRAAFSIIVVRSTLHHVLDVPAFLRDAAGALRPGGVLLAEEPCAEGLILMALLLRLLPDLAHAADAPLDDARLRQARLLVDTVRAYARRDVDKSAMEDKHIFRADELMRWSRLAGLEPEFLPNLTFDHFADPARAPAAPTRFSAFVRAYLSRCMSFGDAFGPALVGPLAPALSLIDDLGDRGCAPHMHGVLVARRGAGA